jgi:hypothetical protein
MAMNVDSVLRLSAKVDGLNGIVAFNRGLQSVETTAKGVTGAMRGMTGAAAGLSGALGSLAPLLSVAGLVGMVQNTIKAGDSMFELSQKTGVAVESLARFNKAAATSGTDIDTVARSLVKLSRGMVEAATTGKGKAADALNALGLSATTAGGRLKTADQLTLEIANKFQRMGNDARKTSLAMDLFGRAGSEMIPMLNMGGNAIENLSVKMTEAFARKADEYSDKLAILSGKVGALGADLTIALLPALQSVTDAVTGFVTAFNALPDVVKNMAVGGAALAVAWAPLTGIFSAVAGGIAVLSTAFTSVVGYITAVGVSLEGLSVLAIDAGFALASVPVAGWIAAAVAGLAALSVALYQNSEGFKNWADTSLNFIKVLASDGMNTMRSFAQTLASMWGRLVGVARGVGSGIASAFSGPFGVIASVAKSVFDFVAQKIMGLWNLLPAGVRKAVGGVGTYFQGAWNRASGMAAATGSGSGNGGGGGGGNLNTDLNGSGGSGGTKAAKGRESQLDTINAANGLFRSQEAIKARIAVAERSQNTSEKFRLEMVDRGVRLLAEAADIQREKISQADKDAKLQGIADRLQASQAQYAREIAGLQKQNIDGLPFYVNELELITSEYGKNVEAAKQFTAEQEKQKQLADSIGNSIGQGMVSAFDALVTGAENFGASLQKIASGVLVDIAKQLMQIYVINTAINAISSFFGPKSAGASMFTPNFAALEFAAKGMVAANGIKPFAKGGIVDRPTLFRFASGGAGNLGLMGEAGPEAIMPLKRGRDGKLGVAGGGGDVSVTVNVDAGGTSVSGDGDKAGEFGKAISLAVRQEIIKQQRPGGLLS